jgi:hypothetical protein
VNNGQVVEVAGYSELIREDGNYWNHVRREELAVGKRP